MTILLHLFLSFDIVFASALSRINDNKSLHSHTPSFGVTSYHHTGHMRCQLHSPATPKLRNSLKSHAHKFSFAVSSRSKHQTKSFSEFLNLMLHNKTFIQTRPRNCTHALTQTSGARSPRQPRLRNRTSVAISMVKTNQMIY